MIAWSLSCYPQAILNFRRRSTVGVNLAFPAINTLGFMCYFTSTAAMYFSPLIRAQYAARNPASPVPTVRGNDVAFAGHALIICFVLLSMFSRSIWGFEQGAIGSGWRVGKGISGVMIGCVVGVTFMVGLVVVKGSDGGRDPESYAWIDVVSLAASVWFNLCNYEARGITRPSLHTGRSRRQYFMSIQSYVSPSTQDVNSRMYRGRDDWRRINVYLTDVSNPFPKQIYAMGLVKLVVTMVKCIPQVLTNYRRQSTVGWSIEQNQLDVLGGVLSVAQLVIDSSLQADWSGLTNNSVKLGLGGLSLFFDMVRFPSYRPHPIEKGKREQSAIVSLRAKPISG